MAAITLISARTAAVTVPVTYSITQDQVPATIIADNLAGVEDVTVATTTDDGTNAEAASQSGTAVTLTATDNVKGIYSPMTISITKSATVSASKVSIATRRHV